eukprot:COSAG03_NODE_22424_length_291_cov_0.807292_1_plen_42_part_01
MIGGELDVRNIHMLSAMRLVKLGRTSCRTFWDLKMTSRPAMG